MELGTWVELFSQLSEKERANVSPVERPQNKNNTAHVAAKRAMHGAQESMSSRQTRVEQECSGQYKARRREALAMVMVCLNRNRRTKDCSMCHKNNI